MDDARVCTGCVGGVSRVPCPHPSVRAGSVEQSWFRLALQNNFLQGRQTDHVVAACLYIACRRAKTPHMLIDFSEILQANLYTLGNAFLKLCRVLHIHLPIIDPSLYIHRFAHKLELPYKVGTTALQLVKRMKRDWISEGRRPAGICGACTWCGGRRSQ